MVTRYSTGIEEAEVPGLGCPFGDHWRCAFVEKDEAPQTMGSEIYVNGPWLGWIRWGKHDLGMYQNQSCIILLYLGG